MGFQKTRDRIVSRFYWYKQVDDIKRYVQECTKCQENKVANTTNKADMQPIYATRPNQIVTMDLMGPIKSADGKYKHIMVVCDHFTKYVEFFAMKTASASETAKRLVEYISRHGCPESILSDRGTNFQAELMTELWELLDVKQLKTTSYHPQCNGQTERMNRTLQAMIANYVDEKKTNWVQFLPLLQFAYNSAIHSTTKFSPFELTYGREPRLPLDVFNHSTKLELYLNVDSYASTIQDELARAFAKVAQNTEMSIEPHRIRHDRHVRAANFDEKEYVWVLDTSTLTGVSKKLSHRWKGPYIIMQKIDDANYKVKHIDTNRTLMVNKCRLKRCFERQILQNKADKLKATSHEQETGHEQAEIEQQRPQPKKRDRKQNKPTPESTSPLEEPISHENVTECTNMPMTDDNPNVTRRKKKTKKSTPATEQIDEQTKLHGGTEQIEPIRHSKYPMRSRNKPNRLGA